MVVVGGGEVSGKKRAMNELRCKTTRFSASRRNLRDSFKKKKKSATVANQIRKKNLIDRVT